MIMKHFLKYCAVLCAALSILILAGCQNPTDPFQSQSVTGVMITINSGGERTLYPSGTPDFSRYWLVFTKGSDRKEYSMGGREDYVTITDLSSGEWEVNVTGYMIITNGEHAVAEGSRNITVTDGKFERVEIIISSTPVQDGPPGLFTFNATFPDSVNNARLFIYNIGKDYSTSRYNAEWNVQENRLFSVEEWYINSGYYVMTLLINVFNNGFLYRTVAWTEVIHISPGRETRAERNFTDDDLTHFTTIQFTIGDIKVDGNSVDFAHIDVYYDDGRDDFLGSLVASKNEFGQLSLPVFEADSIKLYVSIEAEYNGVKFRKDIDSPLTVLKNNPGPYSITASLGAIHISGTAAVTINSAPVSEVWVVVYDDLGDDIGEVIVSYDANGIGNWSMRLSDEYSGKKVHFWVRARDPAKGYNLLSSANKTINLAEGDFINIAVDITTIKLSGTVNLTVNGSAPAWASVEVYRIVPANIIPGAIAINSGNNDRSDWVASCSLSSTGGNSFSWELSLPVDYVDDTLHFFIEGNHGDKSYSYYYGPIKMPNVNTELPSWNNIAIVVQ